MDLSLTYKVKYNMELNNMYDRLRIVEKEKVLEAISNILKSNKKSKRKRVDFDGVPLKLTTLRMTTFFEDGTKCYCCGLESSHFAIERNLSDLKRNPNANYHLNLWGLDDNGNEILFTHDHVLARSLGGKNDRTNTKTMCTNCNFKKSLDEQEALFKLRGY